MGAGVGVGVVLLVPVPLVLELEPVPDWSEASSVASLFSVVWSEAFDGEVDPVPVEVALDPVAVVVVDVGLVLDVPVVVPVPVMVEVGLAVGVDEAAGVVEVGLVLVVPVPVLDWLDVPVCPVAVEVVEVVLVGVGLGTFTM